MLQHKLSHIIFFNLVFINIFEIIEILGFNLAILKKVSNVLNFVCNLNMTDPLVESCQNCTYFEMRRNLLSQDSNFKISSMRFRDISSEGPLRLL